MRFIEILRRTAQQWDLPEEALKAVAKTKEQTTEPTTEEPACSEKSKTFSASRTR